MRTLYLLFVSTLLLMQSGLSQGITATSTVDTSRHVVPYMYPLILADLTKGWNAETQNNLLSQENTLLRSQVTQLNAIAYGQRLTLRQNQTERDSLVSLSAKNAEKSEAWHKRFKKASAERWLFRIGTAGLFYWKLQPF